MKQIVKRKNSVHRMFLQSLFLVLAAAAMNFISYANANLPVQVTLRVVQKFTNIYGATYPADESVEYLLTAANAGDPLPAGSTGNEYRITLTGNQQAELDPIEFTAPGVYEYTLTNITPAPPFPYSYDSQVYHIKIYVRNNGDYMVVILNGTNHKTADMDWTYIRQSITATPSTPGGSSGGSSGSSRALGGETTSETVPTAEISPKESDPSSHSSIFQLPKTGVVGHSELWIILFCLFTLVLFTCTRLLTAKEQE